MGTGVLISFVCRMEEVRRLKRQVAFLSVQTADLSEGVLEDKK